jgi:CubicO group peptidase (beta-lactamase class C family)
MRAADVRQRASRGFVASGFEAVRNKLDARLLVDPIYSAQLAAYWKGELVVDLVGGPELDEDSVTGVFSSSKGVAGIVIALLAERGELDLDAPVPRYWPDFAAAGKEAVTVRQLLSHQAGLPSLDGGLRPEDLLDCAVGGARLAAEWPRWRPGTAFGYHSITIGILAEELVRQATGRRLQEIYETEIRAPRDIDFYLGLPESQEPRYRANVPIVPTPEQAAEIAGRDTPSDGLFGATFSMPYPAADGGPPIDAIWPNDRRVRAAGQTAVGGVGSAKGLAAAYATTIGEFNGPRLLSPTTVSQVSQQHSWGTDRVAPPLLGSFAILFQLPTHTNNFGSHRAFGHDGAGGSLAFADPVHDLAFGYIPNPMQYPGGSDPKALEFSRSILDCITTLRDDAPRT